MYTVLLPPLIRTTNQKQQDSKEKNESLGGNFTTFDRVCLLKKLLLHPQVHQHFLSFLVNRVMDRIKERERLDMFEQEEKEEEKRRKLEKQRQRSFQTLHFRNASFTFS